jgi:HlyD family secretion protein
MLRLKSVMEWKVRTAAFVVIALVFACVAFAPKPSAQDAARAGRSDTADQKRWQAVAPGRVEPVSGVIKIAAPMMGTISEVLVKVNDKVFAGEPLIRLADDEAQARLAAAEAQVAMRKRGRNDEAAPSRAAARRRAEDNVADADKAVADARATFDRAALDRRAGRASDADLETARTGLARAQDRFKQQQAELRRIEADPNTPLPSFAEGQLNAARADLGSVTAALEKLTIRAPIGGTVLQVNAKPGELAAPSNPQPLLILGDTSALRVRAELDERDFGEIKIGQPVLVRAAAFRGREFAGKVGSIAPLVEQGRINARGQRNTSDVDVVEVLVDLAQADALAVGMKVDVYFQADAH